MSLTMPMMVGSRPSAVILTSWISALLSNQASMFGYWPQLFGNSMLPGMPVLIPLKLVEKTYLTPIDTFRWFLKTLGLLSSPIGIPPELHLVFVDTSDSCLASPMQCAVSTVFHGCFSVSFVDLVSVWHRCTSTT